jgi:hypothetical protein
VSLNHNLILQGCGTSRNRTECAALWRAGDRAALRVREKGRKQEKSK